MGRPSPPRRPLALLLASLLGTVLFAVPAAAHGGSLGADARGSLAVPTWLFLFTGGGAVGASFLLASFVTDRLFLERVHAWHRTRGVPGRAALAAAVRRLGVVGLLVVLASTLFGPTDALGNLGLLVVWVGWWAGFTMSTYLLGNAWPLVNPWRTVADLLPSLDLPYPERLGAWPAVAGLLALVWLEVVSPLADQPRLLGAVVVGYTLVTLAGTVTFGPARWFGSVDPVARVFRYYGRVAPLSWDDGRLRLRLPGSALTEPRLVDGRDEVGFVVALLWVTTYDGFVATAAWDTVARTLVPLGVPPWLLYPLLMVAGYAVFLGVFRLAVRYSRRFADTYRTETALAVAFAPTLLPIAAGYHLAHYLGYFLSLFPAIGAALANPVAGPTLTTTARLPGWFGGLSMAFVLLGHLLAIWVAHAAAYRLFPGRLQAVRSQYPLALAMVFYTVTSLWIVSQPTASVPYV